MAAVKARKDRVSGDSRNGVEKWMKSTDNITVYQGHARFTADHEIRVDDAALTAPEIFINVGARAAIPPLPGIEQTPYLINTTILELDILPEYLVIVGGSYIALEFAQMYRRFGSRVTILERG